MAAKKPPKTEDVAAKWLRLYESLRHESHYICALVGTAFIDYILYSLVGKMLTDSSTAHSLLDDRIDGFVPRARFAYSMGLISKTCLENINEISTIRNAFAHKLDDISFDDSEIAKCCKRLRIPKRKWLMGPTIEVQGPVTKELIEESVKMIKEVRDNTDTNRGRFTCVIAIMATYLREKSDKITQPKRLEDFWDQSPS